MKTKIKTNGRYFTKLRKKQNLTIKELSLKTGISESTLSNIENDKVIPRLRTLLK
ncbi:MAG TPA: helix-turn-helix transcriptional regulator [Candidatus Caccovivens faecavium]|nr:helix-turn-helix transcriptional regulator [Candidatus Caccovivens faecavium]